MRLQLSPTIKNRPYTPHPRDFIQIDEGTPYVVPVGKIFVLTAIGSAAMPDNELPLLAELRANGVLEHMGGLYGCSMDTAITANSFVSDVCTGANVAPCISFAAGVSLAVTGANGTDARAWGYISED